jgi:RimK family alpha-L-glutamate ligase
MKLYIFTGENGGHRMERFREEALKVGDIELIIKDMHKIVISNDGLYDGGEKIEFNDSVVWLFSNLTTVQSIANFLSTKNILSWPNDEAVVFADKFDSGVFFSSNNIPTPKTVFINSKKNIDNIINYLGGFPVVIKKTIGSMGMFVEVVNNKEEIEKFIDDTFVRAEKSGMAFNRIKFILQEFIKDVKGVDYRVLCLDGEILGVIKRTAESGFKSNISLGGKAEKVELDEKLEKYVKKILKKGDIFYAGIDFIKKGDDYIAIEVNTSAQFKGFEKATGINVAGKIIQKLIKKRKNK